MIIFGYYCGTQNTQNITYVRHLNRVGLKGVILNQYYQKVRLTEFFSKVFDSKIISRIIGDIFANSPLLKLTLYAFKGIANFLGALEVKKWSKIQHVGKF